MAITIVGGIYKEHCADPHWSELFGSGTRAAAAISKLNREVQLVGYCGAKDAATLQALARVYGFKASTVVTEGTFEFGYIHPLATPSIRPQPIRKEAPIEVNAECALRFGMLEGEAIVTAGQAVFDPQSSEPSWFSDNGSVASRVTYVLNRKEAQRLSGLSSVEDAARLIAKRDKCYAVVVKADVEGSFVLHDGSFVHIPAYETGSVWSLGSGDVYSAAFAAGWMLEESDPVTAAIRASRAAAYYCNSIALPIPGGQFEYKEAGRETIDYEHIYLAGPYFDLPQRWLVNECRNLLLSYGVKVFSPFHDVGSGHYDDFVPKDLEAIERSHLVLAILHGYDPGTMIEIGHAHANGVKVIVYYQGDDINGLTMLRGMKCDITHDIGTAIYHTCWALRK